WYGHQICGFAIVRLGNAAGVKLTVCVLFALTVTFWVTVIGDPVGGVTVADTVAACAVAGVFVVSAVTVRAELLRLAAVFWMTCAFPSISGPPTWSWTGNCRPVLLSGGICVQSTLSSVSMLFGLFGYTSIATELVPATRRLVMSKLRRA